jgi:hypothetical protein
MNYQVIDDRFCKWHATGGSYWGSQEVSGSNTKILFWGSDKSLTYMTAAEAVVSASQLISDLLPNLVEGGWRESRKLCCVSRPDYGAAPEAKSRKTLSIKEEALLSDARRSAYESMLHQPGHTQMNVMRSVLELKDTPETLGIFGDLLKTATAVQQVERTVKWRKSIPGLQEFKWASLTLGQLAAIHLWAQFGVKPTVSDVNKFLKQLHDKPLAIVTPAESALLVTGKTVRSAYSIDTGVGEAKLENFVQTEIQQRTSILYHNSSSFAPVIQAIKNYQCALLLPEGSEWRHQGTLFARALKPDWTMMPDWFIELCGTEAFEGEELVLPTKDEIGLYFNPPVLSAFQLMAYSWLSDWAWNASQVLKSIERASRRVVVGFEEMWARDTWTWSPRRWSVIPIVAHPQIRLLGNTVITGVPAAEYTFFPGIGFRYVPCMNMSNVYATPPALSVTTRIAYNFVLQVPPTTLWADVTRAQIPLPPIRLPSLFEGTLDAWRIGILGALSIVRLQALSKALKKANWSVAKMAVMWRRPPGFKYRELALIIPAVLAAKEFTK